jgi:hypothetical protein
MVREKAKSMPNGNPDSGIPEFAAPVFPASADIKTILQM